MKALIAAVLATASATITVVGGQELLDAVVPAASEMSARYTLKAVASSARGQALLADDADFTAYLPGALAETPDAEALLLVPGGVQWSDGNTCFELRGGSIYADTEIVECRVD